MLKVGWAEGKFWRTGSAQQPYIKTRKTRELVEEVKNVLGSKFKLEYSMYSTWFLWTEQHSNSKS